MSEPNFIKKAWQAYSGLGLQPQLEDVRRNAGRFDRQVRIRNRIEYAAAAMVIVFFSVRAIVEPALLVRLAHILIVLGTCIVVWQLYRRGSVPEAPTSASTADLIRHHRVNLVRQRDALNSIWLWYLLPLVPGLILFLVASPAVSGKEWVKAASAVFSASLFVGIWWLNRRGADKLQRAIDHLDLLRGERE